MEKQHYYVFQIYKRLMGFIAYSSVEHLSWILLLDFAIIYVDRSGFPGRKLQRLLRDQTKCAVCSSIFR